MTNPQKQQRILSIDAFRGITILVMVFVNELAGVKKIPVWMKHMPADADAMTFVDVVFPAFLFVAGMSIPFALANRQKKGDNFLQLQAHILWRALGLLVLGFFMVNAEEGLNAAATGMPLQIWALSFYAAAILVWQAYSFKNKILIWLLRAIGLAIFIVLGLVYRAGTNGDEYMQPHWWGILGLIGWAYLYTCIIYQVLQKNTLLLCFAIALCTAWYVMAKQDFTAGMPWFRNQAGNASHTSIMLCGLVLSNILFSTSASLQIGTKRFLQAGIFTLALFILGWLLRPEYKISKIYATPTWCLYSAGFCCIVFIVLYWIIDIQVRSRWTAFFKPAATNPLLTYMIPNILFYLFTWFHISIFPGAWRYGLPGLLFSAVYAVLVLFIAKGLTAMKLRLQL